MIRLYMPKQLEQILNWLQSVVANPQALATYYSPTPPFFFHKACFELVHMTSTKNMIQIIFFCYIWICHFTNSLKLTLADL